MFSAGDGGAVDPVCSGEVEAGFDAAFGEFGGGEGVAGKRDGRRGGEGGVGVVTFGSVPSGVGQVGCCADDGDHAGQVQGGVSEGAPVVGGPVRRRGGG